MLPHISNRPSSSITPKWKNPGHVTDLKEKYIQVDKIEKLVYCYCRSFQKGFIGALALRMLYDKFLRLVLTKCVDNTGSADDLPLISNCR